MNRTLAVHLTRNPWLPQVLAILGGVVFFTQLWIFAHMQSSVLDEGLYLYKGLLFASGRYQPFQANGPLTNHMALAFLIPGFVQHWFGAGLRTGRYFAILISMFMLIGMWIASRRMGGKWLACGAVWAVALNPAVAKISSMAISEGLIACMMVWVIVLVIGEERPLWQVILGGGLAAILVMTRINLLLTLPIVLIYIFWQHGKWAGIGASLLGGGFFILLHALYWPNVLRLWAYWLPSQLTPFLADWQSPAGATPSWDPHPPPFSRMMSFLQSFRIHFLSWLGVIAGILLWPQKNGWRSSAHRRGAILLLALFISGAGMHAWASLINDYCVSCFPLYTAFFSSMGILFLVTILASRKSEISRIRQVIVVLLVLLISTSIGFSAFRDLNQVKPELAEKANEIKVTSFLIASEPDLWLVLSEKLDLAEETAHQLVKAIPATILGGMIGVAIIAIVWLVWQSRSRRPQFGLLLLSVFMIIGLLLTPTRVLGGGYTLYDCSGDTITAYEEVGAHLAQTIPANSLVYWKGGLSPVPLLYLPDIRIYPAQLNGDYSLRETGDEDALLRYGWWSMTLAEKWVSEADIVLVEEQFYNGWLKKAIRVANYSELPISPPTSFCRKDSQIHIFQQNP